MDLGLKKKYRSRFSFARWWHMPLVLTILSGAWEIGVRGSFISPLFFPPPSTIFETLGKMVADGRLFSNLSVTLQRMFFALAIGGTIGLLLGLAMGWSRRLRLIVDPFVAAAHHIPKIAVFPIIMLLFGIGELSKLVVLSMGTFFPMLINSMAGVRQISRIHFEVAKNYGAGTWKQLIRVVLPGSLPSILAGLRIASNGALMITLAIELLSAKEGMGVLIWFAWETLRTEELYAALVVTASLGIFFNLVLELLTHKLVHWEAEREV